MKSFSRSASLIENVSTFLHFKQGVGAQWAGNAVSRALADPPTDILPRSREISFSEGAAAEAARAYELLSDYSLIDKPLLFVCAIVSSLCQLCRLRNLIASMLTVGTSRRACLTGDSQIRYQSAGQVNQLNKPQTCLKIQQVF